MLPTTYDTPALESIAMLLKAFERNQTRVLGMAILRDLERINDQEAVHVYSRIKSAVALLPR